MSSPLVNFLVIVLVCLSWAGARAQDTEVMHRACSQFIRGVHANRDPLDQKTGRGSALFSFTYTQGHAHADQIINVPPSDASNFNQVLTVWPLPDGDVETESVRKLQKYLNRTFQVDFLGPLDGALTPSLGLSQLKVFKAFTYGYTYSKEYKFERDQIDKGRNVIFKNKVQYNTFQLSLNLSATQLSPELTSDLQKPSTLSIKDRAVALVTKYGALFISGAIFGVSYTQTDYVPRPFYEIMVQVEDEIIDHDYYMKLPYQKMASTFFRSEDAQIGLKLGRLMRSKGATSFHRRTSLRHRGGFFSPPDLAHLPRDWSKALQRPEMMKLTFGPLSHLITQPKDSQLKREVASIVRTQLLTSVAHNFLDNGLFDMQNLRDFENLFPIAERYFPDLAHFTELTRQQMARFVAVNASALADPSVSPFIKMETIQRALDFADKLSDKAYIGLTSAQVKMTYASILECNRKWNRYHPGTIRRIHAALLEVGRQGDTVFGSTFFTCFKSWRESNDGLSGYLKNWRGKLKQMEQVLWKLRPIMRPVEGGVTFTYKCFPWTG